MTVRKIFLLIMALIEWFALIAQLILHLRSVPLAPAESLIRFFSYFTILTNIIVGIYVTVLFISPEDKKTGLFLNPSAQTAIALYIVVVGLVYNLLLRQLWHSEGLQILIHDLLHTVIPLLSLVYWWKWVDGRSLTYGKIPAWLLFPAGYAVFLLIRGQFAHWYPYPFIDPVLLGYGQVLLNSLLLVGVFLLFSFLFVALGKRSRA